MKFISSIVNQSLQPPRSAEFPMPALERMADGKSADLDARDTGETLQQSVETGKRLETVHKDLPGKQAQQSSGADGDVFEPESGLAAAPSGELPVSSKPVNQQDNPVDSAQLPDDVTGAQARLHEPLSGVAETELPNPVEPSMTRTEEKPEPAASIVDQPEDALSTDNRSGDLSLLSDTRGEAAVVVHPEVDHLGAVADSISEEAGSLMQEPQAPFETHVAGSSALQATESRTSPSDPPQMQEPGRLLFEAIAAFQAKSHADDQADAGDSQRVEPAASSQPPAVELRVQQGLPPEPNSVADLVQPPRESEMPQVRIGQINVLIDEQGSKPKKPSSPATAASPRPFGLRGL